MIRRKSLSPEHKKKIGLANLGKNLGRKHTPEFCERVRQASLGRPCKPETREKMRQNMLGNTLNLGHKLSEETKEKIRKAHRTPEAREQARQIRLKQQFSPETYRKISQANLGKKRTPEAKEKMRQAQLGKKLSEETKQRMRKAHNTPESKERSRQARLKQVLPQKMTSIEVALHDEFKKRHLEFTMHKTMFNRFQPDFVFESAKLIVQADGDYWHTRPEIIERDIRFNKLAADDNWTVFRFSETVIKTDAAKCARSVARFVKQCKA